MSEADVQNCFRRYYSSIRGWDDVPDGQDEFLSTMKTALLAVIRATDALSRDHWVWKHYFEKRVNAHRVADYITFRLRTGPTDELIALAQVAAGFGCGGFTPDWWSRLRALRPIDVRWPIYQACLMARDCEPGNILLWEFLASERLVHDATPVVEAIFEKRDDNIDRLRGEFLDRDSAARIIRLLWTPCAA